jgi:DUF971 family protein
MSVPHAAPGAERPWPLELRLNKAGDTLTIAFDTGQTYELSAEYLRVMTGSAADRGHGLGDRPPVAGKRAARIRRIEPIGRYAVRLVFADGHDSGLYSWEVLHDLGAEQPARWAKYLQDLQKAGLGRD